jgi:flagellar hook-associated protein 3 FlgL
MRVTDAIMQNNLLANLSSNSERLSDAHTRVLTSKKINKPSDGPVDTLNILSIRTKISDIKQYQRNIGQAKTSLEQTQNVVLQLDDIFERLSSLTVQGTTDSYSPTEKVALETEMNMIIEQLVDMANQKANSKYIFAGTANDSMPYQVERNAEGDIINVRTDGTSGDINALIGENIKMKVNINGKNLFEDGQNLFDIAIKIRDDLHADDSTAMRENLNYLDNAKEKIYNYETTIGSKLGRLDSAESRAETDEATFSEFLSNTEGVDDAKAILDYQMELNTLQSLLQAGARLMQPKLSDFLT